MNQPDRIPHLQQKARDALAFIRHLQQRIIDDDCLRSAAALTYLTLFALVPLMTVAYAMLSVAPAFNMAGDQVQRFVFDNFVPSTGREIQDYLQKFSMQARKLSGIGVAFLVVTAYGMLTHIERTLNAIWRAPNRRSGLRSFLLYWAILSLGPLFVGLALAISTYLLSWRVLIDQAGIFMPHVAGIAEIPLRLAPWFLTSAAFTLIYVAVPNCRVPVRDALIGGFVAGFCFELAKQLFAFTVASSYERVYGTFAVLPLFLAWIYFSWVVVLAGAELVFALSGYADRHSRHLPDLLVAIAVLERLWRAHRDGTRLTERKLLRERWLLGRYLLPIDRWAKLRARLMQAGLLKLSDDNELLLGRDLQQMTLWQLIELFAVAPPTHAQIEAAQPLPWLLQYRELIESWRNCGAQMLQIPLTDLFTTSTSSSSTPDSSTTDSSTTITPT